MMYTRVRVKRENVDPIRWGRDVQTISATGMRKLADDLRDKMRDAYERSIHQTEYGTVATGAPSLSNFIVTSPKWSPAGIYTVGAKEGKFHGKTYDEVFRYMDEGTGIYRGGNELWAFPLWSDRAAASPNGYWVTQGQPSKKFISGPAKAQMGTFQRDSMGIFAPAINAYFMKGGIL